MDSRVLARGFTRRLRNLAEVRMDADVCVSLFLNLDSSEFATPKQRKSQIESLLDEARRLVKDSSLDRVSAEAVRDDIDRIREWAEDFTPNDAGSVCVFACSAADLFETIVLAGAAGPSVHLSRAPYIEPLVRSAPSEGLCVFLVNSRGARVMTGTQDQLIERLSIGDDVHRRHDQGGWSQANYQRSVDKSIDDHVQHACDALFAFFKRSPFETLLVACPDELWPLIDRRLHSYLQERFCGRVDVEVEHTTEDEVRTAAKGAVLAEQSRREGELIERLGNATGGGLAAIGLRPTLEALNARRVEVLLVEPSYECGGVVCPSCDWAGIDEKTCPLDGTATRAVDDITETAVEVAVRQSALVHPVEYHDLPTATGGEAIAAILRF